MGPIIALTGPAGVGKTFCAQLFVQHGFKRLRFADPLKAMTRTILGQAGIPAHLLDKFTDGDWKEQAIPELGGVTPRKLMQTLGTEWGREAVDPDLWINLMRRHMMLLDWEQMAVIDDLRFPNEAAFVREEGGFIVQVAGRATTTTETAHVSEQYRPNPDFILQNTEDADFLNNQIHEIVAEVVDR